MNPYEKGKRALQGLFSQAAYLSKSSIEQSLLDLIYFRVSQINGCAYCLDMHSKDLRVSGESEQRLYVLEAWRDAPFYSEREQAALAWAEALTQLPGKQVPDDIYREAKNQFSESELTDLTMAVVNINSFNRINIAFRVEAGAYQPGMHAINQAV